MEAKKRDNEYPRILDSEGCIFGQHLAERYTALVERIELLDAKMSKLIWSLVGAAISFGFLALSLWLN